MNNLKIKICGITSVEDAEMVSEFPIHAIGLNFIKRSKREITLGTARRIMSVLPIHIGSVLIVEDEYLDYINIICKQLDIICIQLHGNETPEYIKKLKDYKLNLKIIKALRAEEKTLDILKSYEKVCDFILLDSSDSKNKMGGTGKTVNWNIAKKIINKSKLPVILAGGLNAENIGEAIKKVKPFGIDINSGVEVSPGKKDKVLIKRLIKNLQDV